MRENKKKSTAGCGRKHNCRRRSLTAVLLALIMTFTMSQTGVYADVLDDIKTEENAMAIVAVDNEDCRMLENLENLSVCISSEAAGVDVTIPVEKVEDEDGYVYFWIGTPAQRIEDSVMRKLAEIQGNIDIMTFGETVEELEELLTDFEVSIQGLPEGHYVMSGSALVFTSEMFQQAIDILSQTFHEEGMEFESFSELIQQLLADYEITLDELFDTSSLTAEDWEELAKAGITAETFVQMKELILNIDSVIAYLCSDEFAGILIADLYLECDCPYLFDFQIQHRYYERVGGKLKLVGIAHEGKYDADWEEYSLRGEEGTLISGNDYKKTVYQGKTYRYEGCYDDEVLYDGFRWKEYRKDSFVLGGPNEFTTGLVLRYIRDADAGAAGGGIIDQGSGSHQTVNTDSGSQTLPENEENEEYIVPGPITGDSSDMAVYLTILAGAVIIISAMTAYHKKK